MFRTKNHNILRFIFDILLLLILFFLLLLPVYLTFNLKIEGVSFKTMGFERVAGTSISR